MTARFAQLVDLLRREFPDYPLSVRSYHSPDDDVIDTFIHILLVPVDRLNDIGDRAWEIACDLYEDLPIHFLMISVSPESSEKYFAQELARARSDREAS